MSNVVSPMGSFMRSVNVLVGGTTLARMASRFSRWKVRFSLSFIASFEPGSSVASFSSDSASHLVRSSTILAVSPALADRPAATFAWPTIVQSS